MRIYDVTLTTRKSEYDITHSEYDINLDELTLQTLLTLQMLKEMVEDEEGQTDNESK